MMMEEWNDKIFDWIEKKKFDQLSKAEQEEVLVYMTHQEYNAQHQLLQESSTAFEHEAQLLIPDPEILAGIRRKTSKSRAGGIFTFQMPAYQSALLLAAMLCLVWLFWPKSEAQIIEKERIVYQQVTDTVFVEKQVEVEIPKTQFVTVHDTVYLQEQKNDIQFLEDQLIAEGITPKSNVALTGIEKSFGNTNLSDQALQAFYVGVN